MRIKEKLKAAVAYLQHDYWLTAWKWRQRFRVVFFGLRNASATIKRTGILVASVILARLVLASVDVSLLRADVLGNYFVAVAAMVGGILAIVFSISIFAQQSATDLSSSGYFEDYTRGLNEKIIYSLVVLTTLVFFAMGLFFNAGEISDFQKELCTYISLMLLASVFILIDWHYQNVSAKLSPLKAISFLEHKALNFLGSTHQDAKRIARLLKGKENGASDGLALATAYGRYLQPQLTFLDRQIENLFEITMRLSTRDEVMSTNRGLAAVCGILKEYLEMRKRSSMAFVSSMSFFAFESDSYDFLMKSFDRLNNAGHRFIKEGKIDNATAVADVYRALAAKAGEITFPQQHYENPIFDQISGYLGFYIKSAMQEKNLDVVLSGARAFGTLAAVALKNNLQTSLHGIQQNICEIAAFGITSKATFITDECIAVWQKILGGLFHYKFFGAQEQISEALKKMGEITQLMHTAMTTGFLPADFINRMSLGKPYNEMHLLISGILKVYFEKLTDDEDKERYRRNLIELIEQIYWNIRGLSEKIPILEVSLTTSIGNLLGNLDAIMIHLLDEKSFADTEGKLREQLYRYIYLPGFVSNKSGSIESSRFESLPESVAKTGILLFRRHFADDLILACVNSLYGMVKAGLEKTKEGGGYDEPRAMVRICYLGILALKQRKAHILTEVGVRIYEFEELFQKKYFTNLPPGIDPDARNVIGLPRRNQLFMEVWEWRDEFRREKYNRYRMRGDAQEMMYDFIDELDIERFMFEVWQSLPADSPIAREIKEGPAKRKEIANLARVLKAWIAKRREVGLPETDPLPEMRAAFPAQGIRRLGTEHNA